MFALLSVALVGLARGACLSDAILSGLRMTPQAAYTPASSNKYCSGVLGGAQACVDMATLATAANDQKNYTMILDAANATLSAINVGNTLSTFTRLCNNTITASNVNKTINNVVITSAMASTCASLSSQLTNFTAVTQTSVLATQFKDCYSTVTRGIYGAYCVMGSSIATNYVTTTQNSLQFTAATNVPGLFFDACNRLIYNACYLNEVSAFLDTITGNTTANTALTASCPASSTLGSCLSNSSACSDTVKTNLFTTFFTPSAVLLGNFLSKTVGSSITTTAAFNNTRRLALKPTNLTTSYLVSSAGFDVVSTVTNLGNGNPLSRLAGAVFLLALSAVLLN